MATTGSGRTEVIEQLRRHGFLEFISEEMIVGRDDVLLSTSRGKNKSHYRDAVIESLRYHFPDYTMVYFTDWLDGIKAVHKQGGIVFGLPQGEGLEQQVNQEALVKEGADFLLGGWRNWQGLLKALSISLEVQRKEWRIPVFQEQAREIPVILPAVRKGGLSLVIEVSEDLKSLDYSEVIDDSGVFASDGSVQYGELKTRHLVRLPSSHLLSPERYMRAHLKGRVKKTVERIWPQGKRYTRYLNTIASWDKEVDKDVWTTNIDTVYLIRCLKDAEWLIRGNIKRIVEIGIGGGHVLVFLSSLLDKVKEIIMTDISIYALRAAKRSIMPFFPEGVRLRAYLGIGLGTVKECKADLIVVNPPYIKSPPFDTLPHTDPYRGTGLIREIVKDGIYKLNSKNPEASIVINISSLAGDDFNQYAQEFGYRLIIEKMGEPLRVPLKIKAISQEWKDWLVEQGWLEFNAQAAADQEPYWHTLQAYRIRPRPGIVQPWSAKRKENVESRIYSDTQNLIDVFNPLLQEKPSPQEDVLRLIFPEIYG
ncbi:MAG: methyltransferase, partial [Chloroflexi bacterium]|nr:methyltransferase [Chloroflexota bacterium]